MYLFDLLNDNIYIFSLLYQKRKKNRAYFWILFLVFPLFLVLMGSICSKGSYEKMSGKKGNKKKKEHPADLDKTMRDGLPSFLLLIYRCSSKERITTFLQEFQRCR